MDIKRRSFGQLVPYILIINDGNTEFVYKSISRNKDALFQTMDGAERKALELSTLNPTWNITIKKSNGVPL